jgi:hypothetical protein
MGLCCSRQEVQLRKNICGWQLAPHYSTYRGLTLGCLTLSQACHTAHCCALPLYLANSVAFPWRDDPWSLTNSRALPYARRVSCKTPLLPHLPPYGDMIFVHLASCLFLCLNRFNTASLPAFLISGSLLNLFPEGFSHFPSAVASRTPDS